jgi:lipopolysaccharide export LptBFGC system permease protein LptF
LFGLIVVAWSFLWLIGLAQLMISYLSYNLRITDFFFWALWQSLGMMPQLWPLLYFVAILYPLIIFIFTGQLYGYYMAGVGMFYFMRILWVSALFMGIGQFFYADTILPLALRQEQKLQATVLPYGGNNSSNDVAFFYEDKLFWAGYFNLANKEVRSLRIITLPSSTEAERYMDAFSGVWHDDLGWVLYDVRTLNDNEEIKLTEELVLGHQPSVEQFMMKSDSYKGMTMRELRSFAAYQKQSGWPYQLTLLEYWRRYFSFILFPLLVCTLIGLRYPLRDQVRPLVLMGVLFMVIYYGIYQFSYVLVKTDRLSALPASLLPLIVIMSGVTGVLWKMHFSREK